jgi:hypothetical protein
MSSQSCNDEQKQLKIKKNKNKRQRRNVYRIEEVSPEKNIKKKSIFDKSILCFKRTLCIFCSTIIILALFCAVLGIFIYSCVMFTNMPTTNNTNIILAFISPIITCPVAFFCSLVILDVFSYYCGFRKGCDFGFMSQCKYL